ncbi:MAG TPA: LON peptidase substrate-binding domain-containing protein [Woeseiaceae bacterium]|nr:LON peptidase substrate-binding domain-containing protein [Woeseiaceae bacterium]
MQVPLFPLRTVLYPKGPLPLRIFEPRYLDMVSECLKNDRPFGVLLIRAGSETGPAITYSTGTLAKIIDWYQGSDGLLGITAVGQQRFRLLHTERRKNNLDVGRIRILPENKNVPLPEEMKPLAKVLESVLDDLGSLYGAVERRYDDAGWVACRFAEILPIAPEVKQACLELDDPVERLNAVRKLIEDVRDTEL